MTQHQPNRGYSFAFFSGLLLGGIGVLFLSAKTSDRTKQQLRVKAGQLRSLLTDPEVQARTKAALGEQYQELKEVYDTTLTRLQDNLARLEGSLQEISESKYIEAVRDAIQHTKEEKNIPVRQMEKIKKYLESDFEYFRSRIDQPGTP